MRIFIAFLLLTSTACAQATAVISGPKEVAPGDLVILDASGSDADSLQWMLANSDKSFLSFEGNRKCVFASGAAGKYEFVLCTALCVDGSATIAVARHTLIVGARIHPEPTPGPLPQPEPKPPLPLPNPEPSLSTVALGARDAARLCRPNAGELTTLAEHLETVASKANALSWSLEQLRAELGKVPGINDDWRARMQPFRELLAKTGPQWQTREAAAAGLFEMSAGIKAAMTVSGAATGSGSLSDAIKAMRGKLDIVDEQIGEVPL